MTLKTMLARMSAQDSHKRKSRPAKISFLDLPPEVRNQIYEDLVATTDRVQVSFTCVVGLSKRKLWFFNVTEPAITRTCKCVRKEYLSLHYSRTVFRFTSQSLRHRQSELIKIWLRSRKDWGRFIMHMEAGIDAMLYHPLDPRSKEWPYELAVLRADVEEDGFLKFSCATESQRVCACNVNTGYGGYTTRPRLESEDGDGATFLGCTFQPWSCGDVGAVRFLSRGAAQDRARG